MRGWYTYQAQAGGLHRWDDEKLVLHAGGMDAANDGMHPIRKPITFPN